ncbi:MAG: hypothetical protein PHE29_10015 [Tissierellia bacterium]|nr:hypothetical protein [Tissierellia bacterium]MDD4781354.1 hypothetical protein [Tissierellia bacterium]
MHLFCYENKNLDKIKYDGVRDFCLCEKVEEEYMRSLIKRGCCEVRVIMKIERKQTSRLE